MRVHYSTRFRIVAALWATLLVSVTPAPVFAHARLVRSVPAAAGQLAVAPTALSLWFSERPEPRFTSIRLLDEAGNSVTLGPVTTESDPSGVTLGVTQPLAPGNYTVVWRTAAADGHATSGRFTFTVVGSQAAPVAAAPHDMPAPARTPAAAGVQAPNPPANAVVQTGSPTYSTPLRWAELVSVLTLIGTVIFRLVILRRAALPAPASEESADRARRLARAALALFIVATLTRVFAQSALVPGASADRIHTVLSVVQGTRWGNGWLVGFAGALLAVAGLMAGGAAAAGWAIAAVGVAGIATAEALTGHAGASTTYVSLAIAADVAHVLGAGGWIGGLTAVLLCGLPSLRALTDDERARAGSRLVRSFHGAAVECVALVLGSAVIASWLRLGAIDALWSTGYGRTLAVKIGLALILLVFGWHHRRTVVIPEWDGATRFVFQRTAMGELLVGALVLAVTAMLVMTALPTH